MCNLSQPTLKYESFAGHKYLCIADVRCCADVRIWFTQVYTCRAHLCKYWKQAPPPLVAKNRAWGWSLEGYSGIQRHLFLLDISISSEMYCTVDGLRILHQFEWSSWSKPKALYKHTFTSLSPGEVGPYWCLGKSPFGPGLWYWHSLHVLLARLLGKITVSPRAHVQRCVTWKQFGVLPHVA